MTQPKLFKNIFSTIDADENTSLDLKKITEAHPYFGLANFYNLKFASSKDLLNGKIAPRTAMFFPSAFYLQTQLRTEEIQITTPAFTEEANTVKDTSPEQKSNEQHPEKEELLFEPLHASDYFASQGIKLSDDALGADKLGKQLKSFTAWLKTMKKVHPDKLPLVNKTTESAVQTQAEQSNIEEEIVTESMAEAYVLQNKHSKAIEIYNKLSLLNPAKSAYFATKIDPLKK